ncbi:MAG TPA: PEPxxWA-CTERM sorting domain-containing protein, partial [Usitatibacter sp.]|nr:PEPxxWA-CTERM sorting domain-containing protein [Usitatibacter sp.]
GQQHAPSAPGNPLARTERGMFGPGLSPGLAPGPLDGANAVARPSTMRYAPVTPVTPVPEPSEWLMMAAGLGMVGYILRRRARRP